MAKNTKFSFLILLCIILPQFVFSISSPLFKTSWHYVKTHAYARLNLGLAQTKPTAAGTVNFSAENFNDYRASSNASWQPEYSVNVGLRQRLWQKLSVQYGLGYYQSDKHQGKGTVYQFGVLPNLAYRYDVSNTRLLLTTRWQYQWLRDWASFADVDIGMADVKASGYAETAFSEGTVVNPGFADKTKSGLAYQLGLGIDYHLAKASTALKNIHAQLGVGYVALPKASLGEMGTTGQSLSVGSVNAMRLWLGISYQF